MSVQMQPPPVPPTALPPLSWPDHITPVTGPTPPSPDQITPVTRPTPPSPDQVSPVTQPSPDQITPVTHPTPAPAPPQPPAQTPVTQAAAAPAAATAAPRRRFLRPFSARNSDAARAAELVLAATARSLEPPSEESVRDILALLRRGGNTADRGTPVGAILYRLRMRLAHSNWQVCFKALILAHAILRGGPPSFVNFLTEHPRDSFSTRTLRGSDKDAEANIPFMRGYARYLSNWCDTRRDTAWPAGKMADRDASMRFAATSGADLLHCLGKVAKFVQRGMGFDASAGREDGRIGLIRTATLMAVHDREVGGSCVRMGMRRIESVLFAEEPENATRLRKLYTSLGGRGAIVGEMERYVANGCRERGRVPWVMAAERACEGSLRPAAEADVQRSVLAWIEGFGRGAITQVVERALHEANVEAVLKTQTLLFGVLRSGGTVSGVRMGNMPTGVEGDVHGELVTWLAEYLEERQAHGADAVEKLERLVSRGECLERVPVGIGVRASPVARRTFEMVVQEVAQVAAEVKAGVAQVVGMFFEEAEGKERMVAVVERAVEMGRRERGGGGMAGRVRVMEPRMEGVGEGGEGVLREMKSMMAGGHVEQAAPGQM